jgi:hypothetical protein
MYIAKVLMKEMETAVRGGQRGGQEEQAKLLLRRGCKKAQDAPMQGEEASKR